MTRITRLDTAFHELAESLRRAPAPLKRAVVSAACEAAVKNAGISTPDTESALTALRQGGQPVDRDLKERLEALAARLDDEYLQRAEDEGEDEKPEALKLFTKARAVAALAAAMEQDAGRLHEAVYEATATTDRPDVLVKSLAARLRGE